MKRYIRSSGGGTGKKVVYYLCQYPDRTPINIDGYQTSGFNSEEDAQLALDDIYNEEYYRDRYPGLQVCSKITYSVYHSNMR